MPLMRKNTNEWGGEENGRSQCFEAYTLECEHMRVYDTHEHKGVEA